MDFHYSMLLLIESVCLKLESWNLRGGVKKCVFFCNLFLIYEKLFIPLQRNVKIIT